MKLLGNRRGKWMIYINGREEYGSKRWGNTRRKVKSERNNGGGRT